MSSGQRAHGLPSSERAALLLLVCCLCTTSFATPAVPSVASGAAAAPSASASGRPPSTHPPVAVSGRADSPAGKAPGEGLEAEAPEANPYTETVTLRLIVTPPVKGVVMWGGKQVAKLAPGSMDTDLVRPRGSGPLDLEIKADGFLPYHTRLYSDRDDKVNVRLYRAEDAPGLFGYRRGASAGDKR